MKKAIICIMFLLLCISSFGSPMFCKQCKNKGYYYSYEMCTVCGGSGKVTYVLSGRHGGRSTRVGRCSNCSKLGSGCKTGYIKVKKRCSCSNSNCKYSKKKKSKRQIDPRLKTFYRRWTHLSLLILGEIFTIEDTTASCGIKRKPLEINPAALVSEC